ncbi:MAG TPA: type IV toxin-antitoxin system AbiEi family antitoxin domain-containing protein [Solirubrobacterales bacterium]|nr:type IV toxin-antitoxin system AbiEi family antitoxin domain-containing protein [Solirubrobacterales bacterium]
MGPKRRTDRGANLARLAAKQHGVVSREQLRHLGMSDTVIRGEIAAARLHRVFRGVYALGHGSIGSRGRLRAATIACDGVVSHRSAGALLGLLDKGPAVIDVIAPPARGRKIDGIRFHRVRSPRRNEVGTVDGIPCTSPARTLVDLAGTVGDWTLRSCFERAAQRRVLDIPAIEASMDPGRRGMTSLRSLADEWRRAAPVAKKGRLKSPQEAKVLPLLLSRHLPPPLLNAPVQIAKGRIEVDFLWPDHRFVVEADSRSFHATHVAFERDRWRDRELLNAGYTTYRVTHQEAEREAAAVTETIAGTLARLAGAASPSSPAK